MLGRYIVMQSFQAGSASLSPMEHSKTACPALPSWPLMILRGEWFTFCHGWDFEAPESTVCLSTLLALFSNAESWGVVFLSGSLRNLPRTHPPGNIHLDKLGNPTEKSMHFDERIRMTLMPCGAQAQDSSSWQETGVHLACNWCLHTLLLSSWQES